MRPGSECEFDGHFGLPEPGIRILGQFDTREPAPTALFRQIELRAYWVAALYEQLHVRPGLACPAAAEVTVLIASGDFAGIRHTGLLLVVDVA